MKLLYITFDQLSLESSYLRRIFSQLEYTQEEHKISVLSLSEHKDTLEVKNKYNKVNFLYHKVSFEGWSLRNIDEVTDHIIDIIEDTKPDLVVLTLEYWDLLKKLSITLENKVPFATIFHAMPFVVSPINPSKDFEKDAVNHSQSQIDEFKKSYILEHYKEARDVFENIQIIASNRTVEFYIKNYFKDSHVWLQQPMILKKESVGKRCLNMKYDFVYMARMESGKGVEYLEDILENISLLINRPIKVAVIGRTDDSFSQQALDKLIQRFKLNKLVSLEYIKWIKEDEKRDFFLKSSVFIYPSILDNFPTVVNEALSYGLPVIVWDVPFSHINYSDINAVLKTPLFDFKLFAENSTKALIERDKLSKDAYRYIDNFTTPENSIEKDFIILKEIVRYNHE